MGLTEGALKRLKEQRDADYYKPWKPGVQMTDAELLWDYIENLRNQVSLARDEAFLNSNYYAATGQPHYSEEERLRGEQGIFG